MEKKISGKHGNRVAVMKERMAVWFWLQHYCWAAA